MKAEKMVDSLGIESILVLTKNATKTTSKVSQCLPKSAEEHDRKELYKRLASVHVKFEERFHQPVLDVLVIPLSSAESETGRTSKTGQSWCVPCPSGKIGPTCRNLPAHICNFVLYFVSWSSPATVNWLACLTVKQQSVSLPD